MMKRLLLMVLVLLTLTFAACDEDPLGGLFEIWDDEKVPTTGTFDLYDTMPEDPETTEPPSIELPPLPG